MREQDQILGVSFRNTARHFRKKYGPIGPEGPRLPSYPDLSIKADRKEIHLHPRWQRTEQCSCGYPCEPCQYGAKDNRRNFCAKLDLRSPKPE